jgi:hypothetical protein
MQKSFKHYLEESVKEYHYRIKTVVPLDEESMDNLEYALTKYNLIDISDVTKTIMQKHPLDFYDVDNAEVYIVDVVTGLPASAYVLQQELRIALRIPEKYIVVRTDNDPIERQGQHLANKQEMEDEADEKGWERESLLNVDSVYPEHEHEEDGSNYYGDEYNQKLNKYLSQVKSERTSDQYEAPAPLFSWMDMPQDYPWAGPTDDFNDGLDAPKPVPYWDIDPNKDIDFRFYDMYTGMYGNFDQDSHTDKRSYKDPKTGKRHVLKRGTNPVRDEGDN